VTDDLAMNRFRALFAGVSAMILAASLGATIRSVSSEAAAASGPMVPARLRATTTAAGQRRSGSATGAPAQQQQVEAIADASGWDWRGAGVTFVVRFHPRACCHWGIWDARSSTIYIGPTAFGTAERLRYVVLHETAHAWQRRAGPTKALMGDYADWGYRGAGALEAGADCIATLWGATRNQSHYWQCPPEALAMAARRLGRA
jgi:hypothetical protein